MIEFENVMEQIETTKKRFMGARDRIPKLEEEIFDLTKAFTEAVIDNASAEKLATIKDELIQVEKELDILTSIDFEKEVKQSLSSDKKLSALVEKFIRQQGETLEQMVTQDEQLSNTVLTCYSALIAAVKGRQAHRSNMVEITGGIQEIKQSLGMPMPHGGCYQPYKDRMKNIPHEQKFNQIRVANGTQPQY